MITALHRRLRRTVRRIARPARLAFNAWLSQQADAEIQRMREARASAEEYEQRQHLKKVRLDIHRNQILKG